MKKFKKLLKIKIPVSLGIGAIALALALVLTTGLFTVAKADFGSSLLDKISLVAGQIVGRDISQKLNDSEVLDDVELALGWNDLSVSPNLNVNGDNTYRVTGSCQDATTTIVSFASPFLMATSSASDVVVSGTYPNGKTVASSTVEMLRLNITGVATSSFTVICGASATPYAAATIAYLSSGEVATSTKAVIENNVTAAQGATVDGGTVAKIMLGPKYPYMVCTVTLSSSATGASGAFTEVTNTFDGKFLARVSKTQY